MKPLHIDFAPPSLLRSINHIRPLTWLLVCLGLALCISFAASAINLTRERDRRALELQTNQTKMVARTTPKPVAKQLHIPETQAKAVNAAIAQLNLPWHQLLDALEAATPPNIALLTIEPDAKKHLVKGMAEAKTSDDMIAYIESLKKQATFQNVVLTKHEINEQDPNKPLRFQFEAYWLTAVEATE